VAYPAAQWPWLIPISEYIWVVARSPTTSDVFNAIAEVRRREILDALMAGEKAVGTIVADLASAAVARVAGQVPADVE
jgi:hypothetical protein